MSIKSVKDSIIKIANLFDSKDESGFVDESCGRMNSQEVLDIVIPIAEKAHFIYKSDSYSFGFKEIGLFSEIKNNRLIWIINFEWLETEGKSMNSYLDTVIASIKLDDETGEIFSVWQKGAKKEMNYLEFLKLLEEDKNLE